MLSTLFSFKGNLDRGTFFKYSLVLVVLAFLFAFLFGSRLSGAFMAPGGFVGLIFLWMWLALFVKRGHTIHVWWVWTVLLALLVAPLTWIIYLAAGKR
ncbi:hypothetical protein Emin_1437 [Elusimicrobium minutum Pei191]|uniref:Uncharacterized protein n=1 Tax=Elusimicrobium minutum (strain Pei191) TaxID=445932 RepID=B2KEP0_ELUMP|nr:hypothetical protein [Elusimicrobium minutum]ACC98986.1 hypothetical protein Emin_1437 [Elusimicrobium minutum Pei191]